jgi:hypothetical protein
LFICNLCWLTGLIFRVITLERWPDFLVKSILVMGWLVALPLGVIWYGVVAFLLARRKIAFNDVQRWLFILNLLFIPAMIIYRLVA